LAERIATRHAARHVIDLAVGEFAWMRFAAEIDDCDLIQIEIAPDQIAEIGEVSH
jgi:hypothetical protein